MEVRFSEDLEKQLHELAAQEGQTADEVVRLAVTGYIEIADARRMLNRRYDDIDSGG